MTRRAFLRTIGSVGLALAVPQIARAQTSDYWTRDRTLWLKRGQSGDEFRVTYWSGGTIDPSNYVRLCYLLRDVRESQTVQMDVGLLNILYGIGYWQELLLGRPAVLILNSGYRSAHTNTTTEGSARNSMHLYGRAADISSAHHSPSQLFQMASFFKLGGVGIYPSHVHVDSGPIRYWQRQGAHPSSLTRR